MSGAAGSNECPSGSARIVNEAACREASRWAGNVVPSSGFVETRSDFPRGCYYVHADEDRAYFNTHPVGAGDSYSHLLCATGTTGALPRVHRARMRRRQRVLRCVQRRVSCCARARSGVRCAVLRGCMARARSRRVVRCVA